MKTSALILIGLLSQSIFGQRSLNSEEFRQVMQGTWRHAETLSIKETSGDIKKVICYDTLIIKKDSSFIWKTKKRDITGKWFILPFFDVGGVPFDDVGICLKPKKSKGVYILAPQFLDDKTFHNDISSTSKKRWRSVVELWTKID